MSQNENNIVDNAVAEAGAYDVIRKRLDEQGGRLKKLIQTLNEERLDEFGGVQIEAVGRARVRTQNNCIPRDIVQVGEQLLFGYNVFIGLKKDTKIKDVFSLYTLSTENGQYELVESDIDNSFLCDSRFKGDFDELYRYYKEARLVKITNKNGKLLAGFQVGERENDLKVFRWSISPDGKQLEYIDNRGERDIQLPDQYDFEWVEITRDDFVHGKHPHVNIADTVFVETIGGDLTIKIEDNTENGLGIYSEPVDEENQSLDDAVFGYAKVGHLILLSIKPYKEESVRYFIFNSLSNSVDRVDAIGDSCIQLPEDHGVIFPGGYYLESGETKSFPGDIRGLRFKRTIRSPNGEDVLYVFYEELEGKFALFSYNLIAKTLQNPIFSNGYALYQDGTLIIFSAEEEATRVHAMQIWQTSYLSAEYASKQPESTSDLGKIGNSELVRGISDLYSICQLLESTEVSMRHYEELNTRTKKIFDSHYWLSESRHENISNVLNEVSATAELVIDEFEKVQGIQQQSKKALQDAHTQQRALLSRVATTTWENAAQFVAAIAEIRKQRGHIATIKGYRYINVDELEALDIELVDTEATLGEQTVSFLADENALDSYSELASEVSQSIESAATNAEIRPLLSNIEDTTSQLDLLSELIATLKIDDTTVRTRIVDTISEVYAKLNQTKARGTQKQKGLGSEEAIAQFSAQFKLFSQSITNALGVADTLEKCDEQLAKLLVQLEDLESQFSEFDQFLADIMEKREEIYESFEAHKQSLMEARQRRAQTISDSTDRILKSIEKRSLKLTDIDELNTYFASDTLVLKTGELVQQLRDLDADVVADDVDARFKALREQAIRSLRDKTDIYEDGGKVIKLGPKHKFSVNQQELDLTIIPRNDELFFHLIGTDYYEHVNDDALRDSKEYWSMSLESETPTLYRGEYLAYLVIRAAQSERDDLSVSILKKATKDRETLTKLVRDFSTPYYKHGYQKGIHDNDAAIIIQAALPAMESANLLMFDPLARGLAMMFWQNLSLVDSEVNSSQWQQRALSAITLKKLFADDNAETLLAKEISSQLLLFTEQFPISVSMHSIAHASTYLVQQLATDATQFTQSKYARELVMGFNGALDDATKAKFTSALKALKSRPDQQWSLAHAWLNAFIHRKQLVHLERYIPEAAANICGDTKLKTNDTKLELTVDDLLGEHVKIEKQSLNISLDDYWQRMQLHETQTLPEYYRYLSLRSELMQIERDQLKLDSFKAKPLSSFVRNRLVNESYLPLIGDNLAKQMGTVGESKRTDLMGLLMMISPPGYGKTTLMEYVANRLGLIFMKINCPALGHDVMSLDPEQAPNSTACQELEKINLAFEMGNNVMLYLDDIQHTHPEFLQKYISLCDGTRRVEGVWRGETKTYDMRGKKFCVVMAGNPYTESGEVFKVPDMLANRADIYNLGDILGDTQEQFALSYVENSLTSNAILAPLATRDMNDVYRLVNMARGDNVATTELSHQYSSAELNEIVSVLQKMFVIQELILKVNQQYIASAAQDDRYRTEPPFKLQGSYRNMNKMAEKVSSVMTQEELMQLIEDHYQGESQLLTSGTEENLLKLAELRGNMSEAQSLRWSQIKEDFLRNKAMGGDDADGAVKIANQMIDLVEQLKKFKSSVDSSLDNTQKRLDTQNELEFKQAESQRQYQTEMSTALLAALNKISDSLSQPSDTHVEIINQPSEQVGNVLTVLADSMENSIKPLILSMEKKMDIDLRTLENIQDLSNRIDSVKTTSAQVSRKVKKTVSKKRAKRAVRKKPSSDDKRF